MLTVKLVCFSVSLMPYALHTYIFSYTKNLHYNYLQTFSIQFSSSKNAAWRFIHILKAADAVGSNGLAAKVPHTYMCMYVRFHEGYFTSLSRSNSYSHWQFAFVLVCRSNTNKIQIFTKIREKICKTTHPWPIHLSVVDGGYTPSYDCVLN